jgi:ankyrin repeat protein
MKNSNPQNGGESLLATRDKDKKTPMHYAAAKGDIQVPKLIKRSMESILSCYSTFRLFVVDR